MKHRIIIVSLAVLVASLGIIGFEGFAEAVLAQVLALVCIVAVIMAVGVAMRPDKRMPSLCDPFVLNCIFLSQFYVVGPITMYVWGFPGATVFFYPFAPEKMMSPLVAVALMLAMTILGFHSKIGVLLADRLPEFGKWRRKLPGSAVVVALVVIGIGGCVGWIQWYGGLATKLSMGYGAVKGGGSVFRLAHIALLMGSLLIWWRVVASPTRSFFRLACLGGVLVFDAVFYGIIYGVRKYVLYIFFGFLAVWLLRRGAKALPKVRLAATMALLLVFFSVWGTVRSRPVMALIEGQDDARYAETRPPYQGYIDAVSIHFGVACMIHDIFPEHEPYRYGRTLLIALFLPIPRAIWPDKPIGIGKELTEYLVGPWYEPTFGYSVAATLPGDFYINFGWLGVAIGGAFLGVLFRAVVSYAVKGMVQGKQLRAARVLIPSTFVMLLGEVRGDMSTMLIFYVLAFAWLVPTLLFFDLDFEGPGRQLSGTPR